MAHRKAVFIDVDGTITDDISAWEKVHLTFGLEAEMNRNVKRFFDGEIDYNTWAIEDVAMWKGKSYDEFRKVLENPKLRAGAVEGIQLLKEAGFDIILISGGIDEMVRHVAKTVSADRFYSNKIGHNNGILDGSVDIKVGNSKSDVIDNILVETNYNLKYCGAMGDNFNDIEMFAKVEYAVAINTDKPDVIDAANAVFGPENFIEAAKAIISNL